MNDRFRLIEIFNDTQRQIWEDRDLNLQTLQTQAGSLLYLPGYECVNPLIKSIPPVISVVEDTTFHCARSFVNGEDKIAVLNFANAYNPGGGVVNGAMAQEECLCRSSNLYPALTMPYLLKNYYKWNSKNTGALGSDSVIYSPGVTVFKTDDRFPQDMKDRFRVDVLTCAAPYVDINKKRPISMEKLKEVHFHRIKNILEVATAHNVDVLVLGAFGCGAFHNPPRLVAEAFHYLLIQKGYGRFFKKVVFAIKANDQQNSNLRAFQEIFSA